METNSFQEKEKYKRAKKRVTALKGFYIHTIVICLVIPFLIFVNYNTYWERKWFWYPMGGGILSVIIHWLAFKVHNSGWEERKIQQYMDEESKFYE